MANAEEAALVQGITIYGANTLKEVVDHVSKIKCDRQGKPLEPERPKLLPQKPTEIIRQNKIHDVDFPIFAGKKAPSGGSNCGGRRA